MRYEKAGPRRRREGGVAMVEFALVLPIFLALVFGIISFGYMLSYRQAISQSAAEGARALAVAPPGMPVATRLTKASAAIDDSLGSYGVSCSGGVLKKGASTIGSCAVVPDIACPNDSTRRCATVTVDHLYRENPLIPSFPGFGVTLPEHLKYTAAVEVSP